MGLNGPPGNRPNERIGGFTMNAQAKQSAITTTVEGNVLTLTFSNGKALTLNAGEIQTFVPGDLSAEVMASAMLHGLKQKLVDAAAISRDPSNGRAATIETKYNAVKEVFDRLIAGQWNKQREGGTATGGLLLAALIRAYPAKTEEQLRAFLSGKTDAEKAALRKNPKIAAIIEEIKAERGAEPSAVGDDLLAELEADGEGDGE